MPTRSCASPGGGKRLGKANGMRSPLARMTLWDSDAPILATSSLPIAICDLNGSSLALPPAQMSGAVDFEIPFGVTFLASFPDGPRVSRSRASERGGAPEEPEHTCQVTVSPKSRLQGSKSSSDLIGYFQPADRRLSPLASFLAASGNARVVTVDGEWTEGHGAGGCFGALGAQMAAIDESFSLLSWCGSDVMPALQKEDSYIAESESLEHEALLPLARSLDFTNHSASLDSSLHVLSPQATFTSHHHLTSVSPLTHTASIPPNVLESPSFNPCCPPSLTLSPQISNPAYPVPALIPAASVPSATEREDCRWSAMVPVAMSMLAAHMPVEKVMEQLLHYDSFIAATQLAIQNAVTLKLDPAYGGTGACSSLTSHNTLIQRHPSASSGNGFAVGMDNQSCSYSVLGQPLGAVLLKFRTREASHAAHKQASKLNPAQEANMSAYSWKGGVRIKSSKSLLSSCETNPPISYEYPGSGASSKDHFDLDSKLDVSPSLENYEQGVIKTTSHAPAQPQVLQPSRYMPAPLSDTSFPGALPAPIVHPAHMHGATQQLTASVSETNTPTITTIPHSYPLQRPPRPIPHTAAAHVGDTCLHAHTTTILNNLPHTAVNQTPSDESSTLALPTTTRSSGAGAARTSSQGGGGGSSTGRPSHCGSSNPHDLDHEDNDHEDSDEKSDDKDEGVVWERVEEEEGEVARED